MRRFGRLMAGLAALALLLILAPSAAAGGRTTVLINSPETGRATSLHYTEGAYRKLTTLLGPLDAPASAGVPLEGAVGSRLVNVTWMTQNQLLWRTDQVYPSDDLSTVWIHSASQLPVPETGFWHRAKDPAALRALLTELGVTGGKPGDGAAGAAGVPGAVRTPVARSASADTGGVEWGWTAAALGVGIAVGLGIRPLSARLPRPLFPRGDDGPRRRLIDT